MSLVFDDLKIVDWEKGYEDYSDVFNEQVKYFIESLNKNLSLITIAVEEQDWAQIYASVHIIKGSSGYVEAKRIEKLTEYFQNMLTPFFNKVNNLGAMPREQYEILESFEIPERIKTLRLSIMLLEQSRDFVNDYKVQIKEQTDQNLYATDIQRITVVMKGIDRQPSLRQLSKISQLQAFDSLKKIPSAQQQFQGSQPSLANMQTITVDKPIESSCCKGCQIM